MQIFCVSVRVCVCVSVWWCVIKTISFKKIKAAVLLKAKGWRERGGGVEKRELFPQTFLLQHAKFHKIGVVRSMKLLYTGGGGGVIISPPRN